jgi:transcriptional regulator with XRE-family HTH domain
MMDCKVSGGKKLKSFSIFVDLKNPQRRRMQGANWQKNMKLKEFAEKVGLSPTTVSRALGGYPEVREETRQRVMEAALKYGYLPNANAVRLATGRAGAIGVVMGRSGGGHFFSEFMGGMATRLEREETDILVSVTVDNNLDEELAIFSGWLRAVVWMALSCTHRVRRMSVSRCSTGSASPSSCTGAQRHPSNMPGLISTTMM